MRNKTFIFACPSLFLLLAMQLGCNQQPSNGFNAAQTKVLNRMDTIAKQSGGDWSKVSPSDQQFLINGPGGGSVQTAQMLLQSRARSLQGGSAGGPPPSGPPKGKVPSSPPAGG